ncbi:MAG: RimK/LysX family protein [Bacteroidetes bacterium]|nr:RimK/LysX family protein [Bacteroidota bacterium]
MKEKKRKTLGRKEKLDFPELGLYGVSAKIDTGAYTGALHCKKAELVERNGEKFVSFLLKDGKKSRRQESPLLKEKFIKNSSGNGEKRYVIRTKVLLFQKLRNIELSLADRSKMDCPVLIGRKFLQEKYLVDVSKINLSLNYIKKPKP